MSKVKRCPTCNEKYNVIWGSKSTTVLCDNPDCTSTEGPDLTPEEWKAIVTEAEEETKEDV
jgi:hypothetical protein